MTIRAGARGSAAILVYHSVALLERDPYGNAIGPEAFRAQMEIVAHRFEPRSLAQISGGLAAGTLTGRCVAVTFDDGYANNLSAALPSLTEYGVPATLFVCTGYVGVDREFWWDELERIIFEASSARVSEPVELSVGGQALQLSVADRAAGIGELWRWLHRFTPEQIDQGLEQIRCWAGLSGRPAPRATHRPLTVAELRELSQSARVELGAHTRHHPALLSLSPAAQRAEIEQSRADLQSWTGQRPVSFAYPYGNPQTDYSPATVEIVRELGFGCAVGTPPGLATAVSPRLELPRFFVTITNAREFERWLAGRFQPRPVRVARKLASWALGRRV
jgi:peptidoglycan/xylan/chitin deacetylase (PgdA/CDA1 family)